MSYDMETDKSWRGVPLTQIWGAETPWDAPEFPLVAPASDQTVLYDVAAGLCGAPLTPKQGQDKWDHGHVRMPCSDENTQLVEDVSGDIHPKKRWELIQDALSKPIQNSEELASAILSYNTQFRDSWKFEALHNLFKEKLEKEEVQYFFDVTLPQIAKLALELPKLIQAPIPLLKQNQNQSISISQQQISTLLANAFFCTFPEINYVKSSEYATYPRINFNTLFDATGSDAVLEKLKCLIHYFRRVCTKAPTGVVTFARRSVPVPNCPVWSQSAKALAIPLHIDSEKVIEDADGLIQVDFANKRIGGGVLRKGCVQEEIRFVVCPELIASMLFTEVMLPNEAVMINGCERYSKYSGYGRAGADSFKWGGAHREPAPAPADASRRRRVALLAMDATKYGKAASQFATDAILRELNKAWVGFSFYADDQPTQYPGVATGNWGCGAYRGRPRLKTLLQLMACAEARRPMAYYTFRDQGIRDEFVAIYELLKRHDVTVGQLYQILERFCATDVPKGNLHAFIERALEGGEEEETKNRSKRTKEKRIGPSDILDVNENGVSEALQMDLLNMFSQEDT